MKTKRRAHATEERFDPLFETAVRPVLAAHPEITYVALFADWRNPEDGETYTYHRRIEDLRRLTPERQP